MKKKASCTYKTDPEREPKLPHALGNKGSGHFTQKGDIYSQIVKQN